MKEEEALAMVHGFQIDYHERVLVHDGAHWQDPTRVSDPEALLELEWGALI